MPGIVGIDSRKFVRDVIKKDGGKGHFESVIGVAIKVRDYIDFKEKYSQAIKETSRILKNVTDFEFLCFNDIILLKIHLSLCKIHRYRLNNHRRLYNGLNSYGTHSLLNFPFLLVH